MIIKTFIEPPLDNNNYLIIDEDTKEAALIDCSDLSIWDKVPMGYGNVGTTSVGENRSSAEGITLKYILLTHGHFDHIAGIKPNNNIPVYMHEGDFKWVSNVNQYMFMMGLASIPIPEINKTVQDGDVIKLGNLEIKVIYTPGHTQGGVCYYVNGALFSGDTIFRESVGRCDLEGGNFSQIVESIKNKIYTLPDDTVIYPGHGKPTTVEWEKEHNFFM